MDIAIELSLIRKVRRIFFATKFIMNASKSRMNEDEQLALILQEQYDSEINGGEIDINDEISKYLPTYAELEKSFRESPTKNNINKNSAPSIVAPEWEGNPFKNKKWYLNFE